MRYLACILLFSLVLFSLGCGTTGGGAANNTAPTNSTTSSSSSQLAANPASVSFGTVAVGSTNSQTVTLSNPGSASVTINQATMSGAGFSVNGLTTPQSLSPGQSSSFTVVFAPSSSGSVAGAVDITNSSSGTPLAVALSGTAATPGTHTVDLSWNASASTVAGYNVYRATTPTGPYQRVNPSLITATTFTDATVLSGTTYYYVATAVDSNSMESPYSSQAQALIPTP